MSTIAIDATYTVDREPSGVAAYSRRLIESIAQLDLSHRFLICYRLSRLGRRRALVRPERGEGPAFALRLFQEPLTFWLKWQADLFHSLAQRPPAFRFRKEIVTVFDLFPITGLGYSSPDFQRKFSALLREAVARASRVLTLSRYTADQLQLHCGVPSERIRVIPAGVDQPQKTMTADERRRERERWVGRGNEMVLMVGAIQTRKNTMNALRALAACPSNYKLVLAGGNGYGSEAVHDFIRRGQLGSRVKVLGYVSADRLRRLYQAASVFLFPSFEEGFGLPVLEAMAYGTPVVASETSSLPEVGGDAALYVNPYNRLDIAEKLRHVAEDAGLRERMVRQGLERVSEFTWERTASETCEVYNEVLDGQEAVPES